MAFALISVGLLGLLLFLLGGNVSMQRRSVVLTQHEAEADPSSGLRKAIRAHGNCVEYVPMLSLMILALGLSMPVLHVGVGCLMIGSVLFRYLHAFSIMTSKSIYDVTALKFIAAMGTYIIGIGLSIILIIRSIALF